MLSNTRRCCSASGLSTTSVSTSPPWRRTATSCSRCSPTTPTTVTRRLGLTTILITKPHRSQVCKTARSRASPPSRWWTLTCRATGPSCRPSTASTAPTSTPPTSGPWRPSGSTTPVETRSVSSSCGCGRLISTQLTYFRFLFQMYHRNVN